MSRLPSITRQAILRLSLSLGLMVLVVLLAALLRLRMPPSTAAQQFAAAAAAATLMAMLIWFGLGSWLLRLSQRVGGLGAAADELSRTRAFTQPLYQQLHDVKRTSGDDIDAVADILEEMAKQSEFSVLERRRHEDQRRLWDMMFTNCKEAIIITDPNNRIVTVNPTFSQLTGYGEEEIIGKNPSLLSSGREREGFYAEMWQQLKQHGRWEGEIHDRRKDGTLYPKWLTIVSVKNEQGAVINYIGTFIDISERKRSEERIHHLATHDALTGLANRALLLEQLHHALTGAAHNHSLLAVLVLDLDRFKWINDSLGHEYGDRLLQTVARRLQDTHASDNVARLGGDEFAILLTDVQDIHEVSAIASKVIEQIAHPFLFDHREFHVTTSLGISLYPHDGGSAEQLLMHADAAMYSAKSAGKNQARFFDITMNRSIIERFEIENGLREALNASRLQVVFQPKQCLHNSVCGGAEALLRWQHPTQGFIPPARFIPIAEETGLINAIGEWVLRRVCQQIRAWHDAGFNPGTIAVNISAQQLESYQFVEMVEGLIAEFRLEEDALEFELTESAILQNPPQSIAILERLRQLGIRLSLDDFGTGYSSLSYLKRLPVDTVKIDRSFVDGLPYDEDDAQIVRMTVAMAKSIGLMVIAEGVEKPEQLGYLKEVGCDLVQGFYIAMPMSVEQYHAWLEKHSFNACAELSSCGQKRCTPIASGSFS